MKLRFSNFKCNLFKEEEKDIIFKGKYQYS